MEDHYTTYVKLIECVTKMGHTVSHGTRYVSGVWRARCESEDLFFKEDGVSLRYLGCMTPTIDENGFSKVTDIFKGG